MRYKVAPGPAEFETLVAVHGALPLVPDDVADCCARVVDRTVVESRDDAREWITFLRALGLARETDRGFERVRVDPGERRDEGALATAFEESVFGASEVLAALNERGSLTEAAAFEAVRRAVPDWERDRHPDWEAVWRERARRLLAWSVVFGLARRTDAGDVVADTP